MPGFTYKIKDRKWTCCDCGTEITVVERGKNMVCQECGNGLFDLLENESQSGQEESWRAKICKPHTR